MRIVFLKAAALVCALSLGLGIYLVGCCDKKITQPVEPKEYYAYFGDQQVPHTYFRYNTATLELDTFYLPYDSYNDGFCISPDGKTMYLHPDNGIVEVSLDSFVVVAEHPIVLPKGIVSGPGHQIVVSPDNRYLAVLMGNLHILDLSDFSVIYSDTSTLFANGWFTDDSRTFFCAVRGTERYEMLEVSLNDSLEVKRHLFEAGSFSQIVTSPDNRMWFLMLYAGYGFSIFQVYDIEKDSVLFSDVRCPGMGHMAITPDGRYVAYSRPGGMQGWCTPYPYITIFDVMGNKIDREVFTFDDSIGAALAIDELWVTPDGGRFVGISGAFSAFGHVFQYNFLSHKVEAQFWGPARRIFSLQGQRGY